MKTKDYRRLSNFLAFLMGFFILADVLDYPFYLFDKTDDPTFFPVPQGVYVFGLLCLIVFYATILHNIKKKGVFIRKNELVFRYFGFIILIMGFSSDILHNYIADDRPAAPRLLAVLGGTLVLISYLFRIGIKMQEDQDLTI